MGAIRRKLTLVIALMAAAMAVSIAMYIRDGIPTKTKPSTASKAEMDAQAVNSVDGERLFKDNCTPYHKMDMVVVGPALRRIRERMPDTLVINFLLYPKQTVQESIYLQNLERQYQGIQHPFFFDKLAKKDIEAVIAYCDTSDPLPVTEKTLP